MIEVCKNCRRPSSGRRPILECDRCHSWFCTDCLTAVREIESEICDRMYYSCFKCDGVVGAVGHQKRQRSVEA